MDGWDQGWMEQVEGKTWSRERDGDRRWRGMERKIGLTGGGTAGWRRQAKAGHGQGVEALRGSRLASPGCFGGQPEGWKGKADIVSRHTHTEEIGR